MRFVDAHHHLWDLTQVDYPWLMARGVKRFFGDPTPIQRNYLPEDLLTESANWVPDKTVHIQVGASEPDSITETRWLQEQASSTPGIPNAIVAFVDLASQDAARDIQKQRQYANVRGVRQIVGRHPGEDQHTGTDKLISDPAWTRGLAALAEAGLSFDLQMIPPQYDALWPVLAGLPQLPVAICHCGSPWDQSYEGMAHWRHWMKRFAALPNIFCKVSGLGMFRRDWKTPDIRPLILEVIERFGPERVMLGSNFPVDKLYRPYEATWDAYFEIAQELDAQEQERIFSGTAEEFYRI